MEPTAEDSNNQEEQSENLPSVQNEITEELIQQVLQIALPYSKQFVSDFIEVLSKNDLMPCIQVNPETKDAHLIFFKKSEISSFQVKKKGIKSSLDLNELAEAAYNQDYESVKEMVEAMDIAEKEDSNKENDK
jgi:hypothetical protein